MVTASEDKTVPLFSVRSGKCFKTNRAHTGDMNDVALLSVATLASVSSDEKARFWHVSDATLAHTMTFENWVYSDASLGRFVVSLRTALGAAPVIIPTAKRLSPNDEICANCSQAATPLQSASRLFDPLTVSQRTNL